MLNIAYTISPSLLRNLSKIESLRQKIILHPLSPKRELSLQFQATISRIVYGFRGIGQNLDYEKVKKTLIDNNTREGSEVLRYKKAIDYIKRDWLVSSEPITPEVLIRLQSIASSGKLRVSKKNFEEILEYLQSTQDNPFIQAAIAKLQLNALSPFSKDSELFSTLCAYIFLYRAGLDCRGFLILEQSLAGGQGYLDQYKLSKNKSNITLWLEYFAKSVSLQLEHVHAEVTRDLTRRHNSSYDKLTELTERQKAILNILDNPNSVITNRNIQKVFKVSQITASRDLSKLAALDLILIHGKGRAIRYTRV